MPIRNADVLDNVNELTNLAIPHGSIKRRGRDLSAPQAGLLGPYGGCVAPYGMP